MPLLDAVRTPLLPSEQAAEAQSLGLRKASDQLDLNGASELERGWKSAGLGGRANALYTQAAHAYNKGDMRGGEALELQARDIDQQTQQWAPTVQRMTDIRSLRDAGNWAMGALGNMRTSVAPAAGSLAGAVVGGGVGAVVGPGGAAAGLRTGSYLGGTLAGYDAEADEAIANAMRDPQIRASRSMQDIINAGRTKGVVNSALEGTVPAMTVNRLAGQGAKKLLKGEVAGHIGKEMAKEGAGEFLTEGAQNLTGQATENYLKNKGLTDNLDYTQALNDAAAGAVGGGGMGIIGGGAQALHGIGQSVGEKVNEVRNDPLGKAIDAGVDIAGKIGAGGAKLEDWFQRATSEPHRSLDALVYPERYPMSDDDRKANATAWAEHVLTNPNDFSDQERSNAQQFIQTGNTALYRDKLSITHHEAANTTAMRAIGDEIQDSLPKQSRMGASTEQGKISEQLADLWLRTDAKQFGLFKKVGDTADAKHTATMLMEWVRSGFGAEHNEVEDPETGEITREAFVPKSLVDELGDDAAKVAISMAKLAKRQGVFYGDDKAILSMHDTLRGRAMDKSSDYNFVDQMLTPLAHQHWNDQKSKTFVDAMRSANGNVSDAMEKGIKDLFGPNAKAVLHHFREQLKSPKYGKSTDDLVGGDVSMDKDGNIINDDNVSPEEDYESDIQVTPGETRVTYKGLGGKDRPFNTLYKEQNDDLMKLKSTLSNEHGLRQRVVGHHDALKEQFGHNPELLHEKENEALMATGASEEHLNGLSAEDRASLLKGYNRSHKVVRTEEMASPSLPDRITPDKIDSFREKDFTVGKGKSARAVNTPEHGRIFLQRKEKVDEETGEATGKNESFMTSPARLIKHVWASQKEHPFENPKGKGKGARGEYEAFMRGLAALIESDSSFTGRIAWLDGDGNTHVVKGVDNLPSGTKLMRYTVGDAAIRQNSKFVGPPGVSPYSESEAQLEAGDEIRTDTDRDIVPSEGSEEAQKDTLLAEGSQGEIHRDKYGVQKGLGLDAEGMALGGHGRGTEAGKAVGKGKADSFVPERNVTDDFGNEVRAKGQRVQTGKGRVAESRGPNDSSAAPLATKETPGRIKASKHADEVEDATNENAEPGSQPSNERSGAGGVETGRTASDEAEKSATGNSGTDQRQGFDGSDQSGNSKGERWSVDLLRKGVPAALQAVGKMTYAQLEKFHSTLLAMSPFNTQNDFWQRNELPEQVDALQRRVDKVLSSVEDRLYDEAAPTAELDEKQPSLLDRTIAEFNGLKTKRDKINFLFSELKNTLDETESTIFGYRFTYGKDQSQYELAQYLEFMANTVRKLRSEMSPKQFDALDEMLFKAYRTFKVWAGDKHVVDVLNGGEKSSEVNTKGNQRSTPEQVVAAEKHILDTLGDSVQLEFKKFLKGSASGVWTPKAVKNSIKIALNSDVLGTAYHESMHEFISMLRKNGADNVVDLLKRVGSNQIVIKQLQRKLSAHPEAIKQLTDHDEAVAYAYQFHRAGAIKLGPQTTTFFQKITKAFNSILGRVSNEVKDAEMAEHILNAFSSGAVKDDATRAAIIKAMSDNVEQHDKQIEALGKSVSSTLNAIGSVAFSAEAMMELTKSKHMTDIARGFNQKAGEAKGHKQAYFDAYKQQLGIWMNRLEDILGDVDKEDLEIAREALATGTVAHNPASKKVVDAIHEFNEKFYGYFTGRGTKRWDAEATNSKWGTKGDWVDVPHRKNYFPRVWDSSQIIANTAKFKEMLLTHHMPQLEAITKAANAELEAYKKSGAGKLGDAATAAKDSNTSVTYEMVADAIVSRLANSNGHTDLAESTSNIGMSPVATAVNKRELDWIDDTEFDEFKQKDLVKIMSSYVTNMVKRAEYTQRFGPGGERLAEKGDMAVLDKLGGNGLINQARNDMPKAVERWKKEKAAALKAGLPFETPFPTIRSVGQLIHFAKVGREQGIRDLSRSLKDLGGGFRAIMAMEGTLGNDITPGARSINSALITYQALRLLPLSLFGSMNDVMGLVVNGGELGDAWTAFTKAMREIKMSWQGKKSTDTDAQRAAIWGTVESTAALDSLGQTYGSMYLSDKAKRISDALFKWNGMEAWNRAMRITATSVAERVIAGYAKNGIDTKDEAAVARFERLFGTSFKVDDIKLSSDGSLDTNDAANQAAVMRWVNDAVMTPNASHRTTWGSDPHFAAIWQLKQFAYTMHRVMIKNAVSQAKLGNYRPVMTMLCGYAPVMIAADAVKEMMIPGDEPPWMKMGLGGYIAHGMDRAGVLGVPQMIFDDVNSDYGASLFGPTISQIMHAPFDEAGKTSLGALPAGGLLRRAA